MLYLLRAHCLAGRVIYFQEKNKSVDLRLIIQKTGNKIWDHKEQILCFLLDLCWGNQDMKSMSTAMVPNEGCRQEKLKYVTIHRLCNFTHFTQINLFTLWTIWNEIKFPHAVHSILSFFQDFWLIVGMGKTGTKTQICSI